MAVRGRTNDYEQEVGSGQETGQEGEAQEGDTGGGQAVGVA